MSRELNISRETTRRKIDELEKNNIIKKTDLGIIVQTEFFNDKFKEENKNFLILICRFVSKFSNFLVEEKLVKEKINPEIVQKSVIENFTYSWKVFFEMQIPFMIDCKNFFGDLETWHIFIISFINQNYEVQKYLKSNNLKIKTRKDFFEIHIKLKEKIGINGMSISNLTGIPRATVIRKLKKLIKNKHLIVDDKKLYYPAYKNYYVSNKIKLHLSNLHKISFFLNKLLNLSIITK